MPAHLPWAQSVKALRHSLLMPVYRPYKQGLVATIPTFANMDHLASSDHSPLLPGYSATLRLAAHYQVRRYRWDKSASYQPRLTLKDLLASF
jgi:hypothetical protein